LPAFLRSRDSAGGPAELVLAPEPTVPKKERDEASATRAGRTKIGSTGLILAYGLFNTLIFHGPLLAFAFANLDLTARSAIWIVLTLLVVVTGITVLLLSLLALLMPRLLKPVIYLLTMGNALALYFMVSYGVVLDRSMMGNLFNTDLAEASALLHPSLLLALLGLGLIPCWIVARLELRPSSLVRRLALPLATAAVALGWLAGSGSTWLWIDQHARQLGGKVLPWSYLVNGARHLAAMAAPSHRAMLPQVRPDPAAGQGRRVVVLVIGESARRQNHALYGYGRATTPEMNRAGVTVLQARACATYTTAALECLLAFESPGSRPAWEPLTSYLQRNGVDVTWRSHNGGEPPMAVSHKERLEHIAPGCKDDQCTHDEGLLRGLEARIAGSPSQRQLIVLHLAGSHGPAYHTRYPQRFEVFQPVCKSVQLDRCTREELVNAYDNSIRYADFVVGSTIAMLRRLDLQSSLIYVSDHGESLGESGLYLHGTPWAIAPDVQKDIPFVLWQSHGPRSHGAPPRYIDGQFSQMHVAHSVMGALGLRSAVADPAQDVFRLEGAR